MVRQISVFIENKKGRLATVTETLAQNNIDIVALSIADTEHYGILRAIVNDTDRAVAALREAGFTVQAANVVACLVPDRPGGLSGLLADLSQRDVSVEYLYSFVRAPGDKALIIFRFDDGERARHALAELNVEALSHEQVLAFER